MSYGNCSSDGGRVICELFSDFFSTTFLQPTSSSHINTNIISYDSTNCLINTIEVDITTVRTHLKSLDLNKSAGPDGLPAILFRNCADELALPVSLLFKRSIAEGLLPTLWKSAFITPIHKKGAKDRVENYRPISKLCLLAKVLERIVHDQLYSSLRSCFGPQQHGFLKGRSTTSNLIMFVDFLTEHMDDGVQVDAVYTDFSKAFDRIDHDILLKKLFELGIRGDLLRWFSSYVLNRMQSVVLNGFMSSWIPIPSGVPQGSLLGPLLFILFLYDIQYCFRHSKYLLFADDLKIYRSIKNISDAYLLQEDISNFANYCFHNNLNLNIAKCNIISFTRKNKPIIHTYNINNQNLLRTPVIRDLGILLDSKLTFESHIDSIVSQSARALGFVIRNTSHFNQMKTLKILYCAYVRSHLEYGSQIWNPCFASHSHRIEKIQKKFTRYLCYKFNIPKFHYDLRCNRFHLLPLSVRRNISDVRFLLKVAQSKLDYPDLLSKLCLNVPPRHSRIRNIFHIPHARTNGFGQSNGFGHSNGFSGQSNGFSGQSNGFSGQSHGFSGQSNGFDAQSSGFGGQSNGNFGAATSNRYIPPNHGSPSNGNFGGSSFRPGSSFGSQNQYQSQPQFGAASRQYLAPKASSSFQSPPQQAFDEQTGYQY